MPSDGYMPIVPYEKKKPLDDSLDDFIITNVDWEEKPKRLVSFCIIQVYCPGERVYPVIKFDSAHGHCHVHRYYRELDAEGDEIDKKISPETFDEFRKDVQENWKKYKRLYVEKWLSDQ